MYKTRRKGIIQVITGAVLIAYSGFFTTPFITVGMMGRSRGRSFWNLVLLGGGIIFLTKGVSLLIADYLRQRKRKDNPKQQIIKQENIILRLARDNNGSITVATASLALEKSLDETEQLLNMLVTKGHAAMEVSDEGILHYIFPDFMEQ